MSAVQHGARPVTEAAIAVVVDNVNRRYLMGSRPVGKPYAGYWEFPGGKIEAGETVAEALARELLEELDLTVRRAVPWFVMEHEYPHAYVRLHYMRVSAFSGEPRAMESQEFRWFDIGEFDATLAMLPMNELVVRRLALPEVIREDQCREAPRVIDALSAQDARLQEALYAVLDARLSRGEQLAVLAKEAQRAPLYAVVDDVNELPLWLDAGAQGVVLKSAKEE